MNILRPRSSKSDYKRKALQIVAAKKYFDENLPEIAKKHTDFMEVHLMLKNFGWHVCATILAAVLVYRRHQVISRFKFPIIYLVTIFVQAR